MKYKRQSRIAKIIQEQPIKTHDQLVEILDREGIKVTQATVSRDIKELGLIKTPSPEGSVYAMPPAAKGHSEAAVRSFAETIIEVSCAMHTVVIKTYPGMAQAMCAFIDERMSADFVGSIAGDDTILIIAHDPERAEQFVKKLRSMFK
jgi:transcriptional regulator of arginine metabolism